jgi:membrane fusion protein (multidrug efflux system)
MKTKIKILSGLALTAIAAGMLTACSSSEAKESLPEKTEAPVSNVISLQKEKFTTAIQIPGELTAYRQVDIYAKENSYVKTLMVDVGSQVHTGQLLMTLEAPELTSQLLNAESRWKALYALFVASNANYDRMYETSKTAGTISPNDLDLAAARKNSDSAQYVAAKATYKEIAQLLDYLEIRAPFDGIISARNVNLGAYVGPSGMGSTLPIFTLQQQKHLRLIVSIPEAYTGHLKENDVVSFNVKAFPDKMFQAKVARMAGALDIRLRAEHVEMDVDNSDKKLLPGMVAEVKLNLDGEDSTYVVPQTAIVNTTVHPFVIRINNNKVEWVDIKIGRSYKGKVEVYGALEPNETLVKVASEEIRNGANWNQ